jgi:hypothetical protein
MLRKTGIPAASLSTLFASHAFAGNWIYQARGSQTVVLTGGFGAVADTQGNFYNDGFGDISYDVILDSGSSGFLMSNFVQTSFNVPLINNTTYDETGIGGVETENVTQPIQSYFAPILNNGNPVDGNDSTQFAQYGTTFKFEARQVDPGPDGLEFYDIIGTPVLAHTVMQVIPGHISDEISNGFVSNLAETHLLHALPVLPTHGVYHIPLSFQNFVPGTPVPSEDKNPVIQNVSSKYGSNAPVQADWLLDTGAQFTIISPDFALSMGLDTSTTTPISQVMAGGVGGSTVTFDEYQLTELDIPLSTGDFLVIQDPAVFVPEGNLPPGLTAVLGENFLMQSTDMVNQNTGEATNPQASLWQSWYLDGPGSQLILIDPNSAYAVPEPAGLGLLILGGIPLLMRRARHKSA